MDEADIFQKVRIGSMNEKPSDSLLRDIQNVYGPLLLSDKSWSSDMDPALKNLLTELETGLKKTSNEQRSHTITDEHISNDDFIFFTPQEEIQFWANLGNSKTVDRSMIEHAVQVEEIFDRAKLLDDFINLNQKSLNDFVNEDGSFIGKIKETLMSLWTELDPSRCYGERRMARFMSVTAGTLAHYLQLKLGEYNLWRDEYFEVKNALDIAQEICFEWTKMTQELTGYWWPQDALLQWQGPVHCDHVIELLSKRLEEILHIRNSVEKVKLNLSPHGINDADLEIHVFKPFEQIQPLHITPYTERQWKIMTYEFEKALEPYEKRICQGLRERISRLSSKPQLLLIEFLRNKELIVRHNVKNELSQERSTLLGQLRSFLTSLKGEFSGLQELSKQARENAPQSFSLAQNRVPPVTSLSSVKQQQTSSSSLTQHDGIRSINNTSSGSNNSNSFNHGFALNRSGTTWIVQIIHRAKQIEQNVEQASIAARIFLDDLPDHKTLSSECDLFLTELNTFCNELYICWQQDTQQQDGFGRQWDIGGTSMISFNADKALVVNYDERLVSLFRDVRQLSVLKFRIPADIMHVAQQAQEFHVYAVALKQIANFYNTVHSQVIRSQSEMIMREASELESVIFAFEREKRKWDRRESESQITRLRKAAENFTSENRRLRKYHRMVSDKVVKLMDIDLLREREKYKTHMRDIRGIFAKVAQEFKNTALWETHWNYQLYKALEHQYQKGLECINEHLEEYRVDLVFREKRIQYSPSLEKIRQWYFERVKDFITIPEKFGGINRSNIFRQMIDQNHRGLSVVYRKGTELFSKLSRLQRRYTDQVILGTFDIDQLVDDTVTDLPQWEINFKMLKEKGKDIEKIESMIRIDCIVVLTEPLKMAIEDQLQKLGDALVRSLRQSAQSHLNRIDEFITTAEEKLDNDPQTIEEIGKAHAYCQQLIEDKQKMREEWNAFDHKNIMLRSVASIVVDASTIKDKWNDLDDTISAHDIYLKDRTTHLKEEVEAKLLGFRKDLAKFASRWHELKPKNTQFISKEQALNEIQFIAEKRNEFDELSERYNALITECSYFSIKTQRLSDLDDTEEDIKHYELAWNVYQSYQKELEIMASNDWVSFKKKSAFELEDFVVKWRKRVREADKNSITIHVGDEIDDLNQLKDLIKYLQGEGWTANHWASLFQMIGLDSRSLTVDKLLFKHFIEHADTISKKEMQIRELNERALGEDQIRRSLMDIKVWESVTEFVLVDHNGISGERTPLIAEWGDILNKIGDFLTELQTLKDSRFAEQFSEEIAAYELKLSLLDEYMQNLNLIQRRWVYLSPIMGRNALPSQQQRFNRIDKDFKEIMFNIETDKRATQLARRSLKRTLKSLLSQLEICQKALNEFLEQKRNAFARFYFIGDDDLLEILGQSQDPSIIQTHLKKLFAGIDNVEFDSDNASIVAMNSSHGERVQLNKPILITEKVEMWMSNLDREMNATLESLLFECAESSEFDLLRFPEQILCLSASINFTQKCEDAIRSSALQSLHMQLKSQLKNYTTIEVFDDIVLEMKTKSLILDLIHHIDIVEQLLAASTTSTEDWTWQRQLRFYIEPLPENNERGQNRAVFVRMCDASLAYTYEYQGNVSKLVHTPLTDQCYLVLTQGMHHGYGGNPYGPAGTGKTESVKALAQQLGRQVRSQ